MRRGEVCGDLIKRPDEMRCARAEEIEDSTCTVQ